MMVTDGVPGPYFLPNHETHNNNNPTQLNLRQVPHRQQVQLGRRPRGRRLPGQGDSAQNREALWPSN